MERNHTLGRCRQAKHVGRSLPRSVAWAAALLVATLVTPAAASPLKGIGPQVFLHTAADAQPEDVDRDQWEKLTAQVKERLEESGLQVETGDWFAAQRAFEQGQRASAPGPRIMVILDVLKDKQQRFVYSVRMELRELGYFARPAGAGYQAEGQYLHMDLAFFPEGVTTAPPNRLPRWQAVQSADVASFTTPGSLGYSTWDGVVKSAVAEADRLGQAWKRAQ